MDRRTFIQGLGAAIVLAPGIALSGGRAHAAHADLATVNPKNLVSVKDVLAWHAAKDSKGGPTIAGSPSWKNYLDLLEKEFKAAGVVDVFRNAWTYKRWFTTEYPDDSKWSLHVGGEKMRVASYGCNSGLTPESGVTGELVVYDDSLALSPGSTSLRGKIVILLSQQAWVKIEGPETDRIIVLPAPATRGSVASDYEYLSSADTFTDPKTPRQDGFDLSPFGQMGLGDKAEALLASGAAGVLLVLGLSYDAMSGIYTFPVPALHDLPTLYLDWQTGAKVIEAAHAGKSATLRLLSETEDCETYQLFGYLPGKNYGTDTDEQILLVSHTDGPSISQENGPLGIVSLINYFSKIPQQDRPRTLMVFLDCRHYMPGQERAFAQNDYAASHPEIHKKVIATVGIEHLGQLQVAEDAGQPYHLTKQPELSTVWITNNQSLVDLAIRP